jgi:KDO2-lipid IV(A) lauroyltransferase
MVSLIYLLAYPFVNRDIRIISDNVNRVYHLPPHSSFTKTFAKQNLTTQALILLETIKYLFKPKVFRIVGLEEAAVVLRRASQDGGVVVIAAHHGSWELAGHLAAKLLDRPFYVLAKPSKSKWLTPILNQMREILGMKVLWTDSKNLLRDMLSIAGRHEHLGFVMDQRPEYRQSGYPSVFLGVSDTAIVQGPVTMATKKSMAVVGVTAVRTGDCQYQFYAHEILPAGHKETDGAKIAQKMADHMSNMIRLYPEQWSWNYRRWKK